MKKLAKDVMSTGVQYCLTDTKIPEVAHIMSSRDVSAVIVVDMDGYLAGIISRTDLVELRGYDEYWYGLEASHVMKSDVITCVPDLHLSEASKLLIQHKIHRLVVVESSKKGLRPVGVLSQTDIVKDMTRRHEPAGDYIDRYSGYN